MALAGYKPLYISGNETGLVQQREEFILPDDAYPTLENAFVWRERIKRKQGYSLLGQLQRNIATTDVTGGQVVNILPANIPIGISKFVIGTATFTDPGGASPVNLLTNGPGTGVLDRVAGTLTITGSNPLTAIQFFPGLPVMGIRTRELNSINNEQMVVFDQRYAYIFSGAFQEFITGYTWSGNDSDFFWSTNYWNTPAPANDKVFWVTNFSGTSGDPIRYTAGSAPTVWIDFSPQIDVAGNLLTQCLALLPFRGRLVAFNTLEGMNLAASAPYTNRIRWAAIGNPITTISTLFPGAGDVSADAWKDDVRGKGGFLDIPTTEDIISVGFVRDNLVIYCERSTWQLRYTGRTIAPFQIEKVNSELGAESTFSAVQFDTSLVGIGDKGIVECDSYKSERIDIKIPDLIYQFNNNNNGTKRVHGIRDFVQRIAYWTYPDVNNPNGVYPDKRLIYNYENDSWAIFTDSLTTLGTFQPQTSKRWIDFASLIPENTWAAQNYAWVDRPALIPTIVGGNQQGYVEILDEATTNDVSLTIHNITGNTLNPTSLFVPNHNLQNQQIIQIVGLDPADPFFVLNDGIYEVERTDNDNFTIWEYDSSTKDFDKTVANDPGVFLGKGQIAIRDNFRIISKKFNYLDQGKQFQLGYIDILMDSTTQGEITLNVYNDYNMSDPSNNLPMNASDDTFFNQTVPTRPAGIGIVGGLKNMQRVFCATNSNFITIEWTLSNLQMTTQAQSSDVQIDMQILWNRVGGRMGITQ